MKLKSHISIANTVADLLEAQMDIKIDRDSMELGAVYPDMHFIRRLKIHNLNQVYTNYYAQSNNFINKTNKLSLSFSLGMLSHYICDTFCIAHNKKMRSYKDFKGHVAYELQLSQAIEKYQVDSSIAEKIRLNSDKVLGFDLDSFLTETKGAYLEKSKENYDLQQCYLDIEYSLMANVIVMMGFILELQEAKCPVIETIAI
ncbi:MAG TPA: hypothetical protein DCG38_07325 [Eubacteriaceae bacterium]|nr:hypothetical protein [Eubacteriaceae bacterium]